MSLEMIAFDINSALMHYGLYGDVTPAKLIISALLDSLFIYYLLSRGVYSKFMDKYFPPEVILMFMLLSVIDILVMRDAYLLLLIIAAAMWSIYIFFTHKRFKQQKELFVNFFNKYITNFF